MNEMDFLAPLLLGAVVALVVVGPLVLLGLI